jgi:hypothetical protein
MADIKGRPKKAIIQEKNIGFYVTWKQYTVIQKKAEQAHVNISDYMRQMAVNGYVKAKWTAEEREMVKKLIGISAGIHQLVLIAREKGAVEVEQVFLEYRDKIDEIIEKLCYAR